MLKRAIVVGASSGMGRAVVERLVRDGYKVAAIARSADKLDALAEAMNGDGPQRVWAYPHDVRELEEAADVFRRAVIDMDGLDCIVYAAGVMPRVEIDTFDGAIDRSIVEINVIGAMTWLNLASARFLKQQSGTIVGIGSVAGERGRVGQPAYCASKAALHTYLEALRNRLTRHGVHVLTIKPGPVHTPMTAGLDKLPMAIQADVAADRIVAAIHRQAQVAYIPVQWAPIMAVIRSIPSVLFRRMSV